MSDVWGARAEAYRASPTHANDGDLGLVVEMCNPGPGKKILDVARMKQRLSWEPPTDLPTGLRKTIDWYRDNKATADLRF